jgi:hypothetical protein
MRLMQLGWHESMIKKIASVVGLAPVSFVDTGQSPAAIPEAFAQFLNQL